jgi:hypothetical protein
MEDDLKKIYVRQPEKKDKNGRQPPKKMEGDLKK